MQKNRNPLLQLAYTERKPDGASQSGRRLPELLAMAQHQPIRKNPPASGSDIPDKLYFRIGEVARLCEVPAYVLRFWESEFPQLKPHKGGTGQRLYRRRDVEMALRVKTLLYDEGYTIPGARQVFKSEQKQKDPQLALGIDDAVPTAADPRKLRKLQKDLRDLYALLSKPATRPAVHPIRAARPTNSIPPAGKRATEKLFDRPPHPERH